MRIIYISIGHVAEGVRRKLEDKTLFLIQAGIDVELCWVDAGNVPEEMTNAESLPVSHRVAQKIGTWLFFWRFSVGVDQFNIYRTMHSFLKNKKFDFILMRYPVADYFLWRFIRRYPGKIVFEHNTIEEKELKIRQTHSFYYRYFFLGEKIFGKKVRQLAGGMIGVTPEITSWQTAIAGPKIPRTTVSNGIRVSRVSVRNGSSFKGNELNLLLLAGSEAPWHGVDILLNAFKRYSGDCKIHCYIAGNIASGLRKEAEMMDSVTLLPNQTGIELDRLVDQCHVGIGSLGFGDAFLVQASTLKVREYWSRGLPFLLGYEDVDLIQNTEMVPYYLRVQGDLDLREVVSFALRAYAIPDVSRRLRECAYKYIDYQLKVNAYVAFINSLIE